MREVVDLVGTCPKDFWLEWIAEGDPAGAEWSGEEWGWWTSHHLARLATPGARFYVVAHGKLRGWAPITRLHRDTDGRPACICREGNACAGRIQACLTSLGYAVSFGDARACARAAATADPVSRAIRLQAYLARQTPPIVLTDGQALGAVRAVEG